MESSEGLRLIITEIKDVREKTQFDDWKNTFESYCHPTVGYFYPQGKVVDSFSFHLRDFYKI